MTDELQTAGVSLLCHLLSFRGSSWLLVSSVGWLWVRLLSNLSGCCADDVVCACVWVCYAVLCSRLRRHLGCCCLGWPQGGPTTVQNCMYMCWCSLSDVCLRLKLCQKVSACRVWQEVSVWASADWRLVKCQHVTCCLLVSRPDG